MIQVTLIFVISIAIFVAMRLGLKNSRLSLRTFFSLYLLALVGVVMVFLGLSGRLHWLFALVGSLLPFSGSIFRWGLRLWRTATFLKGIRGMFKHFKYSGGQKKSSGQTSEVQTGALRMVLDHDTGDMNGEVLTGEFAGRKLADLRRDELSALHLSLVGDEESLSILEAFLDREHSGWRDTSTGAGQDSQRNAGRTEMTTSEALEVLGLEPDASADEIKMAHRRIIQKLHPDRGGSTFLASQVNEAKDILLRDHD